MMAGIKKIVLWLARLMGRDFRDQRTGDSLGRALFVTISSDCSIVGLPNAVRPVFLPETTTKYTQHRIGFASHEPPDYRSLSGESRPIKAERLLWAVLVHEEPKKLEALVRHWESLGYSCEQMLFVHAGKKSDFDALNLPNKVFVEDADIRTTFHPMEKQSYGGALREIAVWLQTDKAKGFEAIALVEYDHIPIVPDWGKRLCARMEEEQADLLCHHLTRVDGTNSSHYLYHLNDPRFHDLWKGISLREEKGVCLNAIMTGSVWRRDVLQAVAAKKEATPAYLELYLPSLAHHLGFRVRGHGDQDRFVQVTPVKEPFSPHWKREGAWSLHQVKTLP